MKAAIISLISVSSKWTFEEMKKLFDEVDLLDIRKIDINLGKKEGKILYDNKILPHYDCVYIKGSFRYATIQTSIATLLEGKCYMPIHPSGFLTAHNKLLSQLKFQLANIDMPTTYLAPSVKAARNILTAINYPIIMKFLEGTQGKGVMFADSFPSASSILDAITSLRQPFIIQEYIETGSTDIRAIVVGDEVVGAMQRKAVRGEKRANIHVGGEGVVYEIDDKVKKVAVAAAKAVGAEICAIDILQSARGPLVIEINISPGLQGITRATGSNLAEKIAKFLYKNSKEFHDGTKKNGTKDIMKSLDKETCNNIITKLAMRGNRILLPEVVTKITKFDDTKEVVLTACKDMLKIEKSD